MTPSRQRRKPRARRHWSLEQLESRRLLATVPELEPNDSLINATSFVRNVSTGDRLTGSIARAGDMDYFKVALVQGQTLNVSYSTAMFSEAVTAGIDLLNAAGDVVAQRYLAKDAQFLAPATGDYYIRATSTTAIGTFTGQYDLSVTYGTQSFVADGEPGNNSINTPQPVSNGSYFGGSIASTSDIDYYTVSLAAGQSVAVGFIGTTAINSPAVRLLDAANNVLASDLTGQGLLATVPIDGNYKLEVSAIKGSGTYTGPYLASVSGRIVLSNAATGTEFSTSQPLGTSSQLTSVMGRLDSLVQTHIYTIQTTDLEQINAAVAFNAHNRLLRLYDEQGQLLMYNVNGTVSTGTPDLSRSPGKFFLTVQALQEEALGPYQLVFTTSSFSKQRDVPLFFLDFTSQIAHLGKNWVGNFASTAQIPFVEGMFESRYDVFDVDVTRTLPTTTNEYVGQGYGNFGEFGAGGLGGGTYGVRRPDGDSYVDARFIPSTLSYGATIAMNHEFGHGVGLSHLRSPRGLLSYDTQQPAYPYGSGYSFIAGDSYVPTNYQENSRDYLDFILQAGRQIVDIEPNDSAATALNVDRYLAEMRADFQNGGMFASQGTVPVHVTSLDFNNDGNLDVAVAHETSDTITLLTGDGAGKFTFAASVALPNSGNIKSSGRLLSGDLDGDGIADLAIAAQGGANSYLYTFAGNTSAALTPVVTTLASTSEPRGLVLAKLNNDNALDIAVSYDHGNLVVGLNSGSGSFALTTTFINAQVYAMDAGDVDGDGKTDLVTARLAVGQFGVLRGKGDGTFFPSVNYSTGQFPSTIALWDYDGNGKLDVVVGQSGSRRLDFFANSGTGTFPGAAQSYVHDGDFANLTVGDINADGRADLVGGNYGQLVAFLSLPDGTRSDAIRLPATLQTTAVAIFDANEDGRNDMVGTVYFQNQLETIVGQPNDTRNDRGVVIGNIASAQDVDYISFTATAGQTFVIDVDAAEFQSALDAVLIVTDSSGNTLAASDNALDRESGVDSVDPYVTYTFAAAGTYRARISGVRETVGSYRLKLTPQSAFEMAGPRVIGAVPTGNTNVGTRQIVLLVNDQLDPARLAANIQVVGATTGTRLGTAVFDPIDTTLVWTAEEPLPIDTYTVTLVSGAAGITDLRGNPLDGETVGAFAFPQVSGNGAAGGNFIYQFGVTSVDTTSATLAASYRRHEYNRGLFTFTSSDPLSLTSTAKAVLQARGAGADGAFNTSDDRLLPLDALQDKLSPNQLHLFTRGIPDPDRYRVEGTVLDAVGRTINLASIEINAGVEVPEAALFTDAALTTPGLLGSYINTSLRGVSQDNWVGSQTIAGTRTDSHVHFTTDEFGSRTEVNITGGTDANWDNFSVQWDGYLNVTTAGTRVYTRSNDGSRMWIDVNDDGLFTSNELLVNGWGSARSSTAEGPLSQPLGIGDYKVRIQYESDVNNNEMMLEWLTPDRAGQLENVAHGPSVIDVNIQPNSVIAGNTTNEISVIFSGAVNLATLTTSNFKVRFSPDANFYDANDTFLIDADTVIAWNAATHEATFSTTNKLAAGYYQVEINGDADGVTNLAGYALDGEFLDSYVAGSTLWTWQDNPSGDGLPGGDYLARFSVSTAPQIVSITSDTGASATDRVTSDNTLVLQGKAVASATINVLLGGNQIGTTTSNSSGDWTFDYTSVSLPSEIHRFTATSTVASVTSSPSEAFDVTVDAVIAAPTLIVSDDTGVSASDRITRDATLLLSGTAEPGATLTLSRSGVGVLGTVTASPLSGKWSFDYTSTTLAEGNYLFTVTAADLAGNTASSPFTVTIDKSSGTPIVSSIQDDTGYSASDRITRDNRLVFVGTAEPNSTVRAYGGPAMDILGTTAVSAAGAWTFDYSAAALLDGTHQFLFSTTDVAGNMSGAAQLAVTIDTVSPVLTLGAADLIAASDSNSDACGTHIDNITSDNTPTLTGMAAASLVVEVFVDGLVIGSTTTEPSGAWSLTAPAIADGIHAITWRAVDFAGNATGQSPALTVTIDTGAPTLAPISDQTTAEDQVALVPLVFTDAMQPPQNLCFITQFSNPSLINSAQLSVDGSGGYNKVFHISPVANQSGSTQVGIVAYDMAGNWAPQRTFTLTVQAVNDAPTAVALSANTVAENASGANVGTVSVTDIDVGDSHTWAVDDPRFEIVGQQLKLKSGASLDFESTPPSIMITATDSGGATKSQAFSINVTNVNEAPTSIGLSNLSLTEKVSGAVVGTVTAVDLDAGGSLSLTVNDPRFEISNSQLKLKPGESLDAQITPTIAVTITATDQGALSASQQFTLTVTNVNEAPTNISLSASSFAENLSDAVIANISVTDPDSAPPFALTVDDSRFEIVSGALRIKAGQSFNHEVTPTVNIEITATDAGNLSFTKALTLSVANVNEAPTSVSLSSATITENASAGTLIGQLTAADPDVGGTPTFSTNDSRFSIVGNQLFAAQAFNFEATPTMAVDIVATDAGSLAKTQGFTITVLNVNEAPTGIGLSALAVSENAPGAVVGDVTVTDPDVGDTHTVVASDPRFEVISGQLKLKDGVSLDREIAATISVTLTATDGGNLSTNQDFTIAVHNVPEAPTLITLSGNSVAENAAGIAIGNIAVTDPEGGPHTYALSSNLFSVVDNTLTLNTAVDFEITPSIALDITATDPGGLTRTQTFTIQVTNVNEAPQQVQLLGTTIAENVSAGVIGAVSFVDPDAGDFVTWLVSDARFEVVAGQLKLKSGVFLDHESAAPQVQLTAKDTAGLQGVSSLYTLTVTNVNEAPSDISLSAAQAPENNNGFVIGTLAAADVDLGDTHTYSVADPRFVIVNNNQLAISASANLDFEATPTINVSVTAKDSGNLTTSKVFTILLTNQNEAPHALALSANLVAENAPSAAIGNVLASDQDANTTFSYTVDDTRFEIANGTLRLKSGVSLDYETSPTIPITIGATDNGGLPITRSFTVLVSNVNEAPSLVALSASALPENSVAHAIGTVSGADPDGGDSLTFSVDDPRFEIVAGQLKLNALQAVNFELEPTVALILTARDAAGLTTSQPFTLTVTDVNERATAIALLDSSVRETIAGDSVGALQVADEDASATHTFVVSDNRFQVVGNDLQLKPGEVLDHETAPTISLSVIATDNGGLSFTQDFTINVSNVNEAPIAIFPSGDSIQENRPGGVVTHVNLTVVDPDLNDTHTLTVSDSRFEIVTGHLKLKDGHALDFETTALVVLDITATDAGGLSVNLPFTITVHNVNEAPSAILATPLQVAENTAGALVGQLSASDPDVGDTHTFTVSDPRFEVISGDLRLKPGVALNYEATATINLQVTATDAGGLSRIQPFVIQVGDVNEAPTGINLGAASVSENVAGATIGSISVTDPDVGGTYSLAVTDSRFVVAGGFLRLKPGVALDAEATSTVVVQIQAIDNGGLQVTSDFTISVSNVNEPPTGITGTLSPIPENSPGTVAGYLVVADPESNGPYVFTVSDARFEMVGAQLKLKTGQSLNYEAGATVSVDVTARDAGNLSFTQSIALAVTNVPETPTGIELSRNRAFNGIAGAWVATVTVLDPDATNNYAFQTSDSRFEVRAGQLYVSAGQTLAEAAGQTIPLRIDATDTAAGTSVGRSFTLVVDAGLTDWTHAYQWKPNRYDVNVDGFVTPLDALLIIVRLNAGASSLTPQPGGTLPPLFYDTSGDNFVSPLDVLQVITLLNSSATGQPEQPTDVAASADAAFAEVGAPRAAAPPWMMTWSQPDADDHEDEEENQWWW